MIGVPGGGGHLMRRVLVAVVGVALAFWLILLAYNVFSY